MRTFFILFVIFSCRAFGDAEAVAKADRREEVRKIMLLAERRFKECFAEGLKINPKLAGKVVFEFKVKEMGVVSSVKTVSETLQNKAVLACMIGKAKALQFPPGHNVMFTYPVVFGTSVKR